MHRIALSVAVAMVCATTAACTLKITDPGVRTSGGHRLTAAEAELLSSRLEGAERPRLSLSMSGGGLRSALVNIGAAKALYDDGVLDHVDLVSSVSGGSYAAYWLFGLQSDDPSARFGAAAFANGNFLERACEIVAEANFVPYWRMIGSFRVGPDMWATSREMYFDAITRTFDQPDGNGEGMHATLTMDDLAPMTREHRVPYLIVNATTAERRAAASGMHATWNERLFEFTPLHYGAFEPTPGRRLWSDGHREFPLARAVTASGAAITAVKVPFSAPYADSAPGEVAYLGDGGWSENLGAAAPLLRGSLAHIAVDAQYDTDGGMSAWTRLSNKLHGSGHVLTMARMPSSRAGVYRATSVRDGETTPVYYVKMEIPDWLREEIFVADHDRTREAEARIAAYDRMAELLGKMEPTGPGGSREWQCQRLRNSNIDLDKLVYFIAASHIRFREERNLREALWKLDPPGIGHWISHKFPETTTTDQAMKLDEAMAFIALGYLIANDRVADMLRADGVIPQPAVSAGSSVPGGGP